MMEQYIFSNNILLVSNKERHHNAGIGWFVHERTLPQDIAPQYRNNKQLDSNELKRSGQLSMSAILKQYNLAYISAPKCACTSIKELIFKVENNCNFNKIRDEKNAICFVINGERRYIHSFYPTISFDKQPHQLLQQMECFCVVRNPVERLISCHRNRVLRYGALRAEELEKLNIDAQPDPDLNQFISELDRYMKVYQIWHHAQPLINFLGHKADYYDAIFNFNTLQHLEQYLQLKFNRKVRLPHLQNSKEDSRSKGQTLSSKSIEKIHTTYAEDISCFGQYF